MSDQKYGADGDEGPEVERDVEGLVEAVVLLEVGPVRRPRDEDQMAGRRDRKQLGQPLDDPEHECLGIRQRGRVLPHPEQRENDRASRAQLAATA